MDDDVLNISNWGYYEPFKGGHLGLHLMPGMTDRDTKPFFPGRDPSMFASANDRDSKPFLSGHDASNMFISANDRDSKPFLSGRDPSMFAGVNDCDMKPFLPGRDQYMFIGANGTMHPRDCVVSEAPMSMNYVKDDWISLRDRFFNMPSVTPDNAVLPESSVTYTLQTTQLHDTSRDEKVDSIEDSVDKKVVQSKKRQSRGVLTSPRAKKPRKPKDNSNGSVQRVKPVKKTKELVINGIDMDISGLPIPVCSCTGTPQQCYRWGCGGWQSACCTTNVSIYPLPMNVKRRGARIAGRKMSQGAFKKVLEKLAAEGYNFVNPIDLRTHWARHGTNKFVTIR